MSRKRFSIPIAAFAAALAVLLILCPVASADESGVSADPGVSGENEIGKAIYQKQCVSCHGDKGQGGTDGYSDPLIGDASIGELTELITDTMPEEDPDACVAEQAEAVARYIHETFYSEAAQLRNRAPQRKLSRLTANQLRQSLADLYQHFHGAPRRESKRGLEGIYFNAGRWDNKKKKLSRVDPVVNFDFGREAPVEGVEPKEFYIHWIGSLRAEHTGRYEIVVESTCSFKMRFGEHNRVLIDNHVQSAGKTEFRKTVTLIGGRHYPIAIDFTQRKRKTELPPAKFSLRWVPPGGAETVIPSENLVPSYAPSTFALQTKLPPDDRSYGYARGTNIDRTWDESVTRAALEFADVAATELWRHYKRRHRKDSDENRGRLRTFLKELVGVAFRRPVDEATQQLYINQQLDAEDDDAQAIRRVCLLTVKSPRFLYPRIDEGATPSHRVANRLALILYDSLPSDTWLLKEIENERLGLDHKQSEQRIRQIASRMMDDPRVHGKAIDMFFDWFELELDADMAKDAELYPGFDAAMLTDLRRSFEQTVGQLFWSDRSDYRELFLTDWGWTNARLREFYGETWEAADGFSERNDLVKSVSAPQKRSGVLTHPLVMARLSYYDTSSPIHRGVFLIRHVLGRTLRPPNEAFTPFDPDLHPDLTTRERVALQTGEARCQVCHVKINSLGFALENYDAVGRFRTEERGKPIDASSFYVARDGNTVRFENAADVAKFLAEHNDAHRAFVERVFEHFVKQPIAAYGPETVEELVKRFRDQQFNMRKLILEIAVMVAMEEAKSEKISEST